MAGRQDGEPPLDSNVEKTPEPAEGQVYRLNRKYSKGFDFVKIENITPGENDKRGKARIQLAKWNPETHQWVSVSFSKKMLLITFLEKNDQHNYIFAYNSEEDFYNQENINPVERPVKPISAFEELGEPLPPVQKDEEGNDAPLKDPEGELVLQPEHEVSRQEENAEEDHEPELETSELEIIPAEPKEKVELTPEQKKRAELGERIGLTPEQLTEREALEEEVDKAREAYVTNLYQHEQKLLRVLSILNLKRNPEPDKQYKEHYEQTLKNLQQFDNAHLQRHLLESVPDKDKKETSVASYIERYSRLEALALWNEQQEMRVKLKEDGLEQMNFGKKIIEKVNYLAEEYGKLSWKKKLALGGGLVGLHASIALISAPAAIGAVTLWLGAKVVTGTAAYKSTSKFVEQGAQWAGDKVAYRKDKKEIRNLGQQFQEGLDSKNEYFSKLNEVALKNIKEIDKKLSAYENRSFFAKAAALTVIFGVPLGRYFSDIASAGADAVTTSSDAAGTSTETLTITDHQSEVPTKTPSVSEAIGGKSIPDAGITRAEAGIAGPSLEAVTVEKGDNLWNLVQKQLPANLDEAEKNRITASVQNVIQNKLSGLTEVQIQEQYGLSSKNISLIRSGDVIKLDTLVSKQELSDILKGKVVLPVETGGSPDIQGPAVADASPTTSTPSPEGAGSSPSPASTRSESIGFKSSPLSPEEQYWRDIRQGQGNYQDSVPRYEDGSADALELHQVGVEDTNPEASTSEVYKYEESRPQGLPKEQLPLFKENMILLQDELLDINNTEFGPDYKPGNWKADELWALHKGNSMQDIIAFDHPRFDHDPRDHYREWQWERARNREIYLPPMNPEPQLDSGPDAYAVHTSDTIEKGYRYNLSDMHRAALEKFGNVANPLGRNETVQQYMMRIATLYTRARIENPDFRLNF